MNGPVATHDARAADAVWRTMRVVFGVVPIVAGLDKFTNLLVDWQKYLAPPFAHIVPAHAFMLVVGIIEIVAGIGVLFTPWTKTFATIVGVWLAGHRRGPGDRRLLRHRGARRGDGHLLLLPGADDGAGDAGAAGRPRGRGARLAARQVAAAVGSSSSQAHARSAISAKEGATKSAV